jgi:hypothetical protein
MRPRPVLAEPLAAPVPHHLRLREMRADRAASSLFRQTFRTAKTCGSPGRDAPRTASPLGVDANVAALVDDSPAREPGPIGSTDRWPPAGPAGKVAATARWPLSMKPRVLFAALFVAATAAGQCALAAGAHSHGVARLDVAVDGATVTLRLASPLDSLLGFERAPRNDAERGQVRAMAQALRAGNPFVPTPAARCRLASVELASPVMAPELLGSAAGAAGKSADDHAELDGSFVYRCEAPTALQGIDVMLFDYFKRLQRVEAQVVGPQGQSAVRLTARARQIRLAR